MVRWLGPARDPGDVLPLGNGRLGATLRAERGGRVEIDLTSAEGIDGHGRLLKLARFELTIGPPDWAASDDDTMEQRLALTDAEAVVHHAHFELRARVDRHHPWLVIDVRSTAAATTRVRPLPWRLAPRRPASNESFAFWGRLGGPQPVVVPPDHLRRVTRTDDDGARRAVLGWWHAVGATTLSDSLALQGFADLTGDVEDPVAERAFGTLTWADEDAPDDDGWSLRHTAAPVQRWHVWVHVGSASTAEAWWGAALAARGPALAIDRDDARRLHLASARRAWGAGTLQPTGTPGAERVAAAVAAQRYLTLAAGGGPWPVRFNGSLFTVDVPETLLDPAPYQDPDYRRWNGAFWWQNTRLVYWPLLASGDRTVLEPLLSFVDRIWPLARVRARRWFGAEGAVLPETVTPWGLHADGDYGWDRVGRSICEVANPFVRTYHHATLEVAWLWLQLHRVGGDDEALARRAPQLHDVLSFFASTAHRDAAGRLGWRATQALETYHDVDDSAADIAALHAITRAIAHLPSRLVGRAVHDLAASVARRLPDLPSRRGRDGVRRWRPARTIRGPARNYENPELYAVWPYGLTGRGRAGVGMARATFAARRFKRTGGWYPDAIIAAALGLPEQARAHLERNAAQTCGRFPAMFGPNFDWVPDQDHGNVTVLGLQRLALEALRDLRRAGEPTSRAWPLWWGLRGRLLDAAGAVVELEIEPRTPPRSRV